MGEEGENQVQVTVGGEGVAVVERVCVVNVIEREWVRE